MTPLALSTPPQTSLVSYWNRARLRVAQAKSGSVKPAPGVVPWRIALEDILRIGYGKQSQSRFSRGAWERASWRTVPSAGALYPYEVIASVVGEETCLWDIDAGRLVPCGLPPLSRSDLEAAGFVTRPGHHLEALLILLSRPWMSMQKYHLRGYGYCHLDVGHAATNLALYTAALGHSPILHLRFSRQLVAEYLRLNGLCREPLGAISFESSAAPAAVAAERGSQDDPPLADLLPPPDQREILNWRSLAGIRSLDSPLEAPRTPAGARLLCEPPEARPCPLTSLPPGGPSLSGARDLRSAILGRRSAKGFRREPLSLAQLGALLHGLRSPGLLEDCAPEDSARLGARLVARNVEGLAGVYAYSPGRHALRQIASQAEDPRPACMRQELAGDAAALLILHAPICRLVDGRGYSAFTELHFHAAALAQRMYLAAARLGTAGVTGIGGFDDEQCASLARLEAGDEPIYVILLGVPDDVAIKHDRLHAALSHGYTARQA